MRYVYIITKNGIDNNMKNITNKTKTILFASLIAAMILPFSGMQVAEAKKTESYEVMDIAYALTAIEPYATINEDGSVTIDTSNAVKNISKKDFKIAKDYLKHQNHLVKQLRDAPDKKPVYDEDSLNKFEKLFKHIKDGKEGKQASVTETIGNMFVPKAYAAWGDVCGQSPWNPLPNPPVYLKTGLPTAQSYLTSQGYHQVAFYATTDYGNDYQKNVSAYGCSNDEMRQQGLVQSSITYNDQGPESNPEIHSYTAPAIWWDAYVIAWHLNPF